MLLLLVLECFLTHSSHRYPYASSLECSRFTNRLYVLLRFRPVFSNLALVVAAYRHLHPRKSIPAWGGATTFSLVSLPVIRKISLSKIGVCIPSLFMRSIIFFQYCSWILLHPARCLMDSSCPHEVRHVWSCRVLSLFATYRFLCISFSHVIWSLGVQ